jgi:ATP-dependent DNA ligase
MLAKRVDDLPRRSWIYEPKWDGFRALVFRDRTIEIQSRDAKPLNRYFRIG